MKKVFTILGNTLILSTLLLVVSHTHAANSGDFTLDSKDIKNSAAIVQNTNSLAIVKSPNIQTLASSSNLVLEPTLEPNAYCGNNQKELSEECDGNDLGALSCTDYGFDTGTLSCNSNCQIVTSACSNISSSSPAPSGSGKAYYCGDGILNKNEECDDGNRTNKDGCSMTCHLEEDAGPTQETPKPKTEPDIIPDPKPAAPEATQPIPAPDKTIITQPTPKTKVIPRAHAQTTTPEYVKEKALTPTQIQPDPAHRPKNCPPCPTTHCAAPPASLPFDYFWLIIVLITLNILAYKYLDYFSKNKK